MVLLSIVCCMMEHVVSTLVYSAAFISPPPLSRLRTVITNPAFSRTITLAPHQPRLHYRSPLLAAARRKSATSTGPSSSKKSSTSGTTLVIVESPAKAATIQSILPSQEFRVRSCVGHIREIPSSAKRIPASYKHLPWARVGVDYTSDFSPIYVIIEGKQSVVRDLKAELRQAQRLILATDDDREGEAISWHLLQVLKPTIPVHRAVFHEITANAIKSAFENEFRSLDMGLVDAQETRRVLDRLAGYTMSPLLWKKVARGLSAGRVQSVAMSAVVRREIERLLFISAQYFDCSAVFSAKGKRSSPKCSTFSATLASISGTRIVHGSDFDDSTGKLRTAVNPLSVCILTRHQMDQLSTAVHTAGKAVVSSVECKRTSRHPPPPLITSTLQQECGNRLGMGAGKTMAVAQKLYETGVITYMRTDNPVLSPEAVKACRSTIEKLHGHTFLWNGQGPSRGGKPKAAQAAHEAIRPTGDRFPMPEELENLSEDERDVYAIIYRRTLASQMASAKLDQTTIKLEVDPANEELGKTVEFKVTGSVVIEPGFLRVFEDDGTKVSSSFLPALKEGDILNVHDVVTNQHETKAPPRFNDASLVKFLEEQGVGRPSTYAGIIEKLILRGYIYRGRALPPEKNIPSKALVPSLTAFAVDKLLSTHFSSFVDAKFTAQMEQVLDDIATGSANRISYLQEYYNGENGLMSNVARKEEAIDSHSFKQIILPNMPRGMIGTARTSASENKRLYGASTSYRIDEDTGENRASKDVMVDWSKTKLLVNSYGPYLEENGTIVASLPKFTLAEDLTEEKLTSILSVASDPVIGTDPDSGLVILLKSSRYGPYVQLGRDEDALEGMKPKRCSLLPGMEAEDITTDIALKLLSLPRLLGYHPVSGEEVRAAVGPYGPYLVHGSMFVSLRKDRYNVLDISFDTALELLNASEERKKKRLEKQERERQKMVGEVGKVERSTRKIRMSNDDEAGEKLDEDPLVNNATKKTKKKGKSSVSSGSRAMKSSVKS